MAIASMTGFARVDGQEAGWRWHWEARAVNGKALEVRLRLPNGFEGLEAELREQAARHVRRGSVQVTLQLKDELRAGAVRVNQAVLAELLRIGRELAATLGSPPPTVEGVLALPGVIELGEAERNETELTARNAALLNSAEAMFGHLRDMQRAEGAKLDSVLKGQLERIADLVGEARLGQSRGCRADPQPPRRAARPPDGDRPPASIPTGFTRRPPFSPPAPISRRRSIAWAPISRQPRNCCNRPSRSGAGSISWRRNSTARPTRCAPRRPTRP